MTRAMLLTTLASLVALQGTVQAFGISGNSHHLRKSFAHLASAVDGTGCAPLKSENNGTHFTIKVEVGTPAQVFDVVADTGSNSLIVPSCMCQKGGTCSTKERCFTGGNGTSSTFHMPPSKSGHMEEMLITFGSGQVGAVVAVDMAKVGGVSTNMSDGILLMIEKALRIQGKFEGILGLGLPRQPPVQVLGQIDTEQLRGPGGDSNSSSDPDWLDWLKKLIPGGTSGDSSNVSGDSNPLKKAAHQPKSFLEQSNVSKFSMCFHEDGSGGLLKMGSDLPHNNSLANLGHNHWGLDFRGISVGSAKETLMKTTICTNKSEDQETACGIIPDSGTTAIMGPTSQIMELMEGLCDSWERCKNNHTKLVAAAKAASEAAAAIYGFDPWNKTADSKATVFQYILQDCATWLEDGGSLDEVPSVHFHVAGKGDDAEQILEIPSSSYLVETETEVAKNIKVELFGHEFSIPNKTGVMKKVCLPSFGAMPYHTKMNGDVWILGVPLFSTYRVTYDLEAKPAGSISFTKLAGNGGCGSCDGTDKPATAIQTGDEQATGSSRLRHIRGPVRKPTIDVTRPL